MIIILGSFSIPISSQKYLTRNGNDPPPPPPKKKKQLRKHDVSIDTQKFLVKI